MRDRVSEEELKAAVTSRLSRATMPGRIWSTFKQYVHDCLNAEDTGEYEHCLKILCEKIQGGLNIARELLDEQKPPGRSTAKELNLEPRPIERAYADATREYWETALSKAPEVVDFRNHLPNSTVLGEKDVVYFLTNPLNRILRFEQIEEQGLSSVLWDDVSISRVGIEIDNIEGRGQFACHVYLVRSRELEADVRCDAERQVQFSLVSGTGNYHIFHPKFECSLMAFFQTHDQYEALIQYPQGRVADWVPVYVESVLGYALFISREIASLFRFDERDALMFLLTGRFPERAPLASLYYLPTAFDLLGRPEYETASTIEITVQPFISAETMAKFYRKLQQEMRKQKGGRIPDSRFIEPHNVNLFRFVNERWPMTHEEGQTKSRTWEKLFALWRGRFTDAEWENMPSRRSPRRPREDDEGGVAPAKRSFNWQNMRAKYEDAKRSILPKSNV